MIPWRERTREVANLLNPAFCTLLLSRSVNGYQSIAEKGMPVPLSFLVLPIVLHKETREKLPVRATTSMHAWLEQHPELRMGFPIRAKGIVPFTREAILFSIAARTLEFNDAKSRLKVSQPQIRGINAYSEMSSEIKQCLSKAELVGKLFARAGSPASVYAVLGVRP